MPIAIAIPRFHGAAPSPLLAYAARRALLGFVALCAIAAAPPLHLHAQSPTPDSANIDRRAQAAERNGTVRIDGALDENAWLRATPVTTFTRTQPIEATPATQRTEVRILYDDAALYVGARMYDELGARGVRGRLARRDGMLDLDNGGGSALTTDQLVVSLDTYKDRLGRALFQITPSGVRGDALSIGGSNLDPSWDPIWESATVVDSLGWTAELRIPLSQLRFSRDSVQTWGLQLERVVDRLNERALWAFTRRNEAGGPQRYGSLDGIVVNERPRQLEVLPYVVARGRYSSIGEGSPFHHSTETKTQLGGDVKYLLTSNLTLDATVNPDFGQVEVDPATVNLSDFEQFFDEKRPFFVAGSGAFGFGGFSCYFCSNVSSLSVFYSRRIGRAPQLNSYVANSSQFMDAPDNATILGAAKLTGRTRNGWTVGVLDAVTRREEATRLVTSGAPRLRQAVEPLSNYFVGRLKRDFRKGNTTVGGIVTSTARRLDDQVLLDSLRSSANVVGLDHVSRWRNRTYSLRTSGAISDVRGEASAITRTQRSSARYFQRPDRTTSRDGLFGASLDPDATALRGYGFYARVAKDAGNWRWETAQNVRSPGFEVNDLAFQSKADYHWMNANVSRLWTTPTSWYRTINTIAGGQREQNYDGDVTFQQAHVYYGIELPNFWNVSAYGIHKPVALDDRATRGGPTVKRAGYRDLGFNLSSDARKRVVGSVSSEFLTGVGELNSSYYVAPRILAKPASNVSVSFGPFFSRSHSAAQYVRRVGDDTALPEFFGQRYIFSDLRQTSLSLDTRLNVTFTPTLTLELFAQPFFASGHYTDFKEYVGTRTITTAIYGSVMPVRDTLGRTTSYTIDPDGEGEAAAFSLRNPDFAVRSLRGNAVVRWEYRPGSTLFLVWTQERSGAEDWSGDFDLARHRAGMYRDRPTNIVQLKASYWLGR